MRKTALQMARELQAKGYKVTVIFRKEGGARISSINGVHYKGSEGTAEARRILGESLSEAQRRHLKNIKQKKGVFGKPKKPALPKDILDLQKEINKEFKKKEKSARVRRSQIRYRIEKEGGSEQEAREYLQRALKYAKGYAYNEALETYILRLQQDLSTARNSDKKYLQEIIDAVEAILIEGMNLKERDFQELLQLTYQWESGIGADKITIQDFKNSAISILSRAK